MRKDTIRRKIATKGFRQISGDDWLRDQICGILSSGKLAFDATMRDLGRIFAEAIMYIEREELSGPEHEPSSPRRLGSHQK